MALIGPSGQGKTTTLRLLLGLFHPQKGKIRVGNPKGDSLEVSASTRCLFSYIPQGNTLFSGTIAENMRMVKPKATDEEIIHALKASCAWEFVEKLEEGIDTQVREQGQRFSEGQKQRLSIARALLADAPVMILDEATSSIDTRTEAIVQQGMDSLMCGRTVFVIAHRLSTVRNSNAIMVLDHGRIVERGDHEDLIAQHGLYYQLYTGAFELE